MGKIRNTKRGKEVKGFQMIPSLLSFRGLSPQDYKNGRGSRGVTRVTTLGEKKKIVGKNLGNGGIFVPKGIDTQIVGFLPLSNGGNGLSVEQSRFVRKSTLFTKYWAIFRTELNFNQTLPPSPHR